MQPFIFICLMWLHLKIFLCLVSTNNYYYANISRIVTDTYIQQSKWSDESYPYRVYGEYRRRHRNPSLGRLEPPLCRNPLRPYYVLLLLPLLVKTQVTTRTTTLPSTRLYAWGPQGMLAWRAGQLMASTSTERDLPSSLLPRDLFFL